MPGRVLAVSRGGAEVDVILATIRHLESGANYTIGPNRAGASGAYQYIPSTWNGHEGYSAAYLAPPQVQDNRARADVERILSAYAGDVSMVPVMWYFPLAAREPAWMDRVPNPAGGNRLTVREYQRRWLDILATTGAELGAGEVSRTQPASISVLSEMPRRPAPAGSSGAVADPDASASASPVAPSPVAGTGPLTFDAVTVSEPTMAMAARSAPPDELPPHGAGSMRSIAFPVLGPVTYEDGWGDCRDGCRRRHQGTDIVGVRMQPLLAVVDGTVTRARYDSLGTAGVIITITDADGWSYNYFHINNDTPGSDDGVAAAAWRLPPQLRVGDRVTAGEVIGYMGDSGNSEGSVPHLHFEIRDPQGVAHPSYWSLQAAEARQACTIGLGPWAARGPSEPVGDRAAGEVHDGAEAPVFVTTVRPLFGDGSWLIDTQGRVTATGDAALIVPGKNLQCEPGPIVPFGTEGAGWTTAADTLVLDGTTLEGAAPAWLAQYGLHLPLAPVEAVASTAASLGGSTAPAEAAPVPAFQDPSTGETVLVATMVPPPRTAPLGSGRGPRWIFAL